MRRLQAQVRRRRNGGIRGEEGVGELEERIAKTKFDFPIYSYTRLDDGTVGEAFAGLPGIGVWWVDNTPGERAHIAIFR